MAGPVDLSDTPSFFSLAHRCARAGWQLVWLFTFRPSPVPLHGWRRFLLRLFGARLGKGVHVYPSARVWAPWQLEMGNYSCLSHYVDCYCVDKVLIEDHVVVSQYSYLCTATHDYSHPKMPLVTAPIRLRRGSWIAAGVFVALGVEVGEGAVVLARSVVTRSVAPWTVVAGNPARFIKERRIERTSA